MNKIKEITINDLKFLKEMSDIALGTDYLTLDYFEKVINSPLYFGWVVYSDAHIPVAFLIAYRTSRMEIQHYLKDYSIANQLTENTVCLDTMVVNPNYRYKGIGKRLIDNAMLKFPENSFIMYAWKSKVGINMERIAKYYNFKILKEYPDLWTEDCLANKFSCPSKDGDCCSCVTVVYYRAYRIN